MGRVFFFYKVLIGALPPFAVVFGRVALAAVTLNLILVVRRDPMRTSPGLWAGFLVLGVFDCALPFCCFAWSEFRLSSGMAAILNATTPIFAGSLSTGERMTLPRAAGVGFGFLGVIMLYLQKLRARFRNRGKIWGTHLQHRCGLEPTALQLLVFCRSHEAFIPYRPKPAQGFAPVTRFMRKPVPTFRNAL